MWAVRFFKWIALFIVQAKCVFIILFQRIRTTSKCCACKCVWKFRCDKCAQIILCVGNDFYRAMAQQSSTLPNLWMMNKGGKNSFDVSLRAHESENVHFDDGNVASGRTSNRMHTHTCSRFGVNEPNKRNVNALQNGVCAVRALVCVRSLRYAAHGSGKCYFF